MDEDQARTVLAQKMDARRVQLRLRWTEVARRAGMTPQNLNRIRKDRIAITWEAADRIEHALQWEPGSIESILAGREPTLVRPGAIRRPPGPPSHLTLGSPEWLAWYASQLSEDGFLDLIARIGELTQERRSRRRGRVAERDVPQDWSDAP